MEEKTKIQEIITPPGEGEGKTPSSREIMLKRIKTSFPDDEINDENYDEYVNRWGEGLEKERDNYRDNVKKFTDVVMNNEYASKFVGAMAAQKDPIMFLIDEFGEDFKKALDDPEIAKQVADAYAEKQKKEAADKQAGEKFVENLNASFDKFDELADQHGWDDEKKKEILDFVQSVGEEINSGDITEKTYMLAAKAIGYDKMLDEKDNERREAEAEAEVRGRNAKIQAKLKSKEDMLPADIGGSQVKDSPKRKFRIPDAFSAGGYREVER